MARRGGFFRRIAQAVRSVFTREGRAARRAEPEVRPELAPEILPTVTPETTDLVTWDERESGRLYIGDYKVSTGQWIDIGGRKHDELKSEKDLPRTDMVTVQIIDPETGKSPPNVGRGDGWVTVGGPFDDWEDLLRHLDYLINVDEY